MHKKTDVFLLQASTILTLVYGAPPPPKALLHENKSSKQLGIRQQKMPLLYLLSV